MVATDTIVGIVGAVVLVAVMAGVFVYEYNNVPEADGPEAQQAHFEEDYAGLAATQDIDGDGVPNFEDPDLDGDGVNNTEDDMVSVVVPVQATVAAPGATGSTPYTMTFTVGNGSEHFEGAIQYTRAAGGVAPNVQASLSGPSGFDTVQASSTNSGNTYTLSFDIEEPLPPGEYTLTLSQQPAGGVLPVGQPASVEGELEVHYASPAEGGHAHA